MPNNTWSIRLVPYYPEGHQYRVSLHEGRTPTATQPGFFTKDEALALADKLNG